MPIKDSPTLTQLLKKQEHEKIILVENPAPEIIKIEDYALNRAFGICKYVKEQSFFRSGNEWYGFLASSKSNPKVITDILLEENETNNSAYTKISPEEIAKASEKAAEENKIIIGWIHSHADMGVFFSGTDDDNIETVLNSVSLNNRVHISDEELMVEKLGLILNGQKKNDGSLIVKLDSDDGDKTKINGAKILEPVYAGWSYNIVVNDKSEHYQEIAVLKENLLTKNKRVSRKKVELDIIPTGRKVDYKKLKKEVEEKIKIHSWNPTQWRYGQRGNYGQGYATVGKNQRIRNVLGKKKKKKVKFHTQPRTLRHGEVSAEHVYLFIGKLLDMAYFLPKSKSLIFELQDKLAKNKVLTNSGQARNYIFPSDKLVDKINQYTQQDTAFRLFIEDIKYTTVYQAFNSLKKYLRK